MSIIIRLKLMVFGPILIFLAIAAYLVTKDFNIYRDSQIADESVSLLIDISKLNHLLQVERGMGAGFIAGNVASEKLLGHRKKVDELLVILLSLIHI